MTTINVSPSVPEGLTADQAIAALAAANDEHTPRVMVRGPALVRMIEAGELEAYDEHSLRYALSRVAKFKRYDIRSKKHVNTKAPRDLLQMVLKSDSSDYIGLPRVDRVVTAPVVVATDDGGGKIITDPGYHAEGRVWYRPDRRLEGLQVPERVSGFDVITARDYLLEDLLGDFAWADDGGASKANALGLLLLPFCRSIIDGNTPMHAILARDVGSGKTLLAQALLMPSCGDVPLMPDARDDEEYRKRITAALMGGSSAIVFDNIKDGLGNPALAAALTTGIWRDRILGVSKEATIPVRSVFACTGNNLSMSREITRRTAGIMLEAGSTKPSDKPDSAFRHPDLLSWTREHRRQLVEAALVIIQNWLAEQWLFEGHLIPPDGYAGRVIGTRSLGSFGEWARVIGGILDAADIPGFMENDKTFQAESNVEESELVDFLRTWHELGLAPMLSQELAKACGPLGSAPALRDALPSELAGKREDVLLTELRTWLRAHKKVHAGGYQLIALGKRPPLSWSVQKTGN